MQETAGRSDPGQGQDDHLRRLQRNAVRIRDVCEDENGATKPYVLHAEANAITKVAKSGNSSLGATLYVTASPCIECSKLIIQAGIKRVVYKDEYRLTDGVDLLRKAGIKVEKID